MNLTEGRNAIPLGTLPKSSKTGNTVVRINSWGWQNNRVNLESLELNGVSGYFFLLRVGSVFDICFVPKGAKLLPFTPSKLAFQFIGDSLSAVSTKLFSSFCTSSSLLYIFLSLRASFSHKASTKLGRSLLAKHSRPSTPSKRSLELRSP